MEDTIQYPDGTFASFQLGIQSVPEGVFILSLDITARKRAEAELHRSREEFKDLFDKAPTGYHEVDATGRLARINQAELKMLGYTAEELVGRFVWEIAANPGDSRQAVEAKLAGVPPPVAFERIFRRKDGSTFPVLIEDRLVKSREGNTIGIRAVVQDITERKRAEDDIRQMNADLERRVIERTVQLETANKELEAFSYSVSHDLRTPLRAMDGFSQAVQEDFGPLLPPEGRHQLKTIRESAQRMGELIDDLLTFSKLSRQALRKQTVDTEKLVRGVIDELRNPADETRVEIRFGELPPCEGDSALLRQVWINLVSNALKYTRQRDLAVVEIGCERQGGDTIYFVRDNGMGFDMRYAHKLFGVFQRLHRAEEYEGTGVGLAIVQRVVHRHGGRVWANAALNEGAIFQFTLNETNHP
jgi:PAS domain S-box-containing protein